MPQTHDELLTFQGNAFTLSCVDCVHYATMAFSEEIAIPFCADSLSTEGIAVLILQPETYKCDKFKIPEEEIQ